MSLSERRPEQTAEQSQTATDWAFCLVRWGLFAYLLFLALFDPFETLPVDVLFLATIAFGAYNLAITTLLALGLLTRAIPAFTLIADTIAVLALLPLTGGAEGLFFFAPLFPILVATLRFGWEPGLLLAVVYGLALGLAALLGWEDGQPWTDLLPAILQSLMFLLAVVIGGAAGGRAATEQAGQETSADSALYLPDRVKMVYELASTLSATLNYQRVLEAILDISHLGFDELGYRVGESVAMVLLYNENQELYPASYRNLVVPEDEQRRIKGVSGIVGRAIDSAEALIGGSPAEDPELRAFRSLAQCQSTLCVPLRAGFETYGVVLFASTKPDVYHPEHLDLLVIFCNQATIALQNATLYQSLQEERDKIIDQEEQARRKLARDLHDGPTQDIAAIAMRLNFARLLIDRDPARARVELARLEDLAHRTVKEIRSMLFTLRPIILETEGLVAAVNQYAENLRQNDNLPVEVDAEQYRDCLDSEAQGVVFAIIEEAVNNAKKHANASRIWVQLAVQGDIFVAQVVDDGKGFDVQAVEQSYSTRGSLGMLNLKERAELIGGTLTIDSVPGRGTRITLIVPIEEEI